MTVVDEWALKLETANSRLRAPSIDFRRRLRNELGGWEHWEQPEICWYEGSHLSFPIEAKVKQFVGQALADRLGVDVG